MEPRRINMYARSALGYFLTSGPDTEDNRAEHEIFDRACRSATKALFEGKIRASNFHEKKNILGIVQENLGKDICEHAKELGYGPYIDLDAATFWAGSILNAAMGARNNAVEKAKDAKLGKMVAEHEDIDEYVEDRASAEWKTVKPRKVAKHHE